MSILVWYFTGWVTKQNTKTHFTLRCSDWADWRGLDIIYYRSWFATSLDANGNFEDQKQLEIWAGNSQIFHGHLSQYNTDSRQDFARKKQETESIQLEHVRYDEAVEATKSSQITVPEGSFTSGAEKKS